MTRAIAVVIFPRFQILDATGPISAFDIAGRMTGGGYDIRLLSETGGEVASSARVRMVAEPLDARQIPPGVAFANELNLASEGIASREPAPSSPAPAPRVP